MYILQMVNGQTHEIYLCDQCAKKTQEVNPLLQQNIGVPGFLQALWGGTGALNELPHQQGGKCPVCGLSFTQITHVGRLGCSMCYETFAAPLASILRKIHGNGRHKGKIPARRGAALRDKMEVKTLKEKLSTLIQQENFEEAAQVRDQIKSIGQAIDTGGAADAEK
jgi:protein arginine kinase activator